MRAKRLPVAGAFHSPLMEPAVEPFRALVDDIEVREPSVPVFSCVTAEPFDDIRGRLVEAITSPVRWLEVMHALESRGAARFVETGPGRVLTNLVRKSLDGVEAEAPLAMEAAGCVSVASASAARHVAPLRASGSLRPAMMASVEMVVPDRVVGNDVIAEGAGVTEQWIVHRTGVQERRWVEDGETSRRSRPRPAARRWHPRRSTPPTSTSCWWPRCRRTRSCPTPRRSWPPSSVRTAQARWTWAPPAPASYPRSPSPPPRSRAAGPTTCS